MTAADLIVHVRDMANPDNSAQKGQVLHVLEELGVVGAQEEGAGGSIPIIEAWNKLDLLDAHQREDLLDAAEENPDVVLISAQSGEGVDALEARVASLLTEGHRRYRLELPVSDGAGAAWLHQNGEVLEHGIDGDLAWYEVRLSPGDMERFKARERA